MKQDNQNRALFDAVSGIDPELVQEAREPRMGRLPKRALRVAAVCLLLLFGLSMAVVGLPAKDEEDPRGFVIYAYANEGEKVELTEGGQYAVDLTKYLLPDADPNQPPRGCSFYIELNDHTRGMTSIDIYCNGELVPDKNKEINIGFAMEHMTGRHLGWYVNCRKKEPVVLQVVLRAEDGTALYQVDFSVTYLDGSFNIVVLPTEPIPN